MLLWLLFQPRDFDLRLLLRLIEALPHVGQVNRHFMVYMVLKFRMLLNCIFKKPQLWSEALYLLWEGGVIRRWGIRLIHQLHVDHVHTIALLFFTRPLASITFFIGRDLITATAKAFTKYVVIIISMLRYVNEPFKICCLANSPLFGLLNRLLPQNRRESRDLHEGVADNISDLLLLILIWGAQRLDLISLLPAVLVLSEARAIFKNWLVWVPPLDATLSYESSILAKCFNLKHLTSLILSWVILAFFFMLQRGINHRIFAIFHVNLPLKEFLKTSFSPSTFFNTLNFYLSNVWIWKVLISFGLSLREWPLRQANGFIFLTKEGRLFHFNYGVVVRDQVVGLDGLL